MVQGIAGEEVSTLDSLCLRRIVKENHGTAIVQACFPPLPTSPNTMIDMTNILATVSASQVNLYDNEHCGDHLDILSTFECSSSKSDDAYICTGGTDQMIRVLSMAKSTEVKQLKGHTGTIVGLACHPMDSNIILSLSEDGTARLWHLEAAKYLVVFSSQGSVAGFHSNGLKMSIGSTSGEIQEWIIPDDILFLSREEALAAPVEYIEESSTIYSNGKAPIDTLRYVNDQLVSKSRNGKIVVWNTQTDAPPHLEFTMKNQGILNCSCIIDISRDDKILACGTSLGTIHFYSLETGRHLHTLKHRRSTKPVRQCLFTREDRGLLYVDEDGAIWRYDPKIEVPSST